MTRNPGRRRSVDRHRGTPITVRGRGCTQLIRQNVSQVPVRLPHLHSSHLRPNRSRMRDCWALSRPARKNFAATRNESYRTRRCLARVRSAALTESAEVPSDRSVGGRPRVHLSLCRSRRRRMRRSLDGAVRCSEPNERRRGCRKHEESGSGGSERCGTGHWGLLHQSRAECRGRFDRRRRRYRIVAGAVATRFNAVDRYRRRVHARSVGIRVLGPTPVVGRPTPRHVRTVPAGVRGARV